MPHSLGVDGSINMIDDDKLVERGVEESTPHAEVVLGEVKDDRNMSTNVHMLDGRGGDRSRVGGGISKWGWRSGRSQRLRRLGSTSREESTTED
jgi:hypothetical protein